MSSTCGVAGVNVKFAARFGLVGRMTPGGISRMIERARDLAAEVAGVVRRHHDRDGRRHLAAGGVGAGGAR